jgi:hypothetical protein
MTGPATHVIKDPRPKVQEPAELPLTLIVATIAGWPSYRSIFEGQRAAVEAVGGEMIIGDGSGLPPPTSDEIGPNTTWINAPGEGIYQLRARAHPRARGAVVAITEDHCAVDPTYGRVLIDLHAEHPEAAVIGGAVENGATRRLDDWAVFFIGHFRDMPGIGSSHRVAMAGLSNVSFKRAALKGLEDIDRMGVNEAMHQRALSSRGQIVLIDDRLTVRHIQSRGLKNMIEISWHSTRTNAAMRRRHVNAMTIVRFLAAPIEPLIYGAMIANAVRRRRYAVGPFVISSPVILGFLGVRAVADIVGFVAGSGGSERRFP